MIIELCSLFKDSNNLMIVRDLAIIALSFAGILRFDKLSSLKCNDVTVHGHFLKLKIVHRKTENILRRLKSVEPNLNLSLHSLRSDGASADTWSDVNERCIKIHGRWKSDGTNDTLQMHLRSFYQYLKFLDDDFPKLSTLSLRFF